MTKRLSPLLLVIVLAAFAKTADAQSIARFWSEELLEAIRNDFARPTVHARNLYHFGIAAHDGWAVYEEEQPTLFLGDTLGGFAVRLDTFPAPDDVDEARRATISYASYRLLRYRFRNSPGRSTTWFELDSAMFALGYDTRYTSTNYLTGDPRALGNYLGNQLIQYGMTDRSNDPDDYRNLRYQSVNPPLIMDSEGNPNIVDPDRWQPLSLSTFIDQSGNPIPGGNQEFLGPEWGQVTPFALDPTDADTFRRDSFDYVVYHDPGPPPTIADDATREAYQRGFEMVAIWGGLLDPDDDTVWDVGPGARGINADPLPDEAGYYDYYNEYGGGDSTGGLRQNPFTGQPYAVSQATRGDYGRVLAEFWADGPDSETPPGHWFTIMNYVFDQPSFVRKWRGQGRLIDTLEYEAKAYLTLGGAMHDAAIATWGIKGWYDYVRPVSAIRYMAEMGQRSDPDAPRYHPHGLRIEPGFIEQIDNLQDPLAGPNGENLAEMKIFTWRGPEFITDPETTAAGVGWHLAKNFWPYQRPTFVSPPFAGYVSGHSTYSRAAAEVLTDITGSEYFPDGLGEFVAPKNEFLVFEEGPSDTVRLQWATYRDASDEVSLSRIFGGIHPPADDIPGRRIGIAVAADAVAKANSVFDSTPPELVGVTVDTIRATEAGATVPAVLTFSEVLDTTVALRFGMEPFVGPATPLEVGDAAWSSDTTATVQIRVPSAGLNLDSAQIFVVEVYDLYDNGFVLESVGRVLYDTKRPTYTASASAAALSPTDTGTLLTITLQFDEQMDVDAPLNLTFPDLDVAGVFAIENARWIDATTYEANYRVNYVAGLTADDVVVEVSASDLVGNPLDETTSQPLLDINFETSGVEVLPSGAVVRLFPVPLADQVSVVSTRQLTGTLRLVSTTGREVARFALASFGESRSPGAHSYRYDVSALAPGSYVVELLTEDGERATWTVVK